MKRKNLMIILIILISLYDIFAQDKNNSKDSEEILFKAMKDELECNIQNLKYKDYKKPFFISYTIADAHTLFINTTLGALISSNETHIRDWNIRVIIGDYQLTDENFYDISNRDEQSFRNLDIPIDNDYHGIRRFLWELTDRVYKSAAQNYKNKISALTVKNIKPEDLPVSDFSQSSIVKINIASKKFNFNKSKY